MRFDELKAWISLASPPKFATTLIPFILGTVLAWAEGNSPDFIALFISLVAVILITAFCFVLNAASVYEDMRNSHILPPYQSERRAEGQSEGQSEGGDAEAQRHKKQKKHEQHKNISSFHTTAATGRFKELLSGRISVENAILGAYISVLLAIPLGFLLQFFLHTGEFTLLIGFIGIFIAYSYSRGLRFSYIGLGEFALAIGVGFLTVFSGYYLQAHSLSMLPLICALPFMIDVFKMKIAREIPDYECDRAINRRNLVVRFGKKFAYCIYLPLTMLAWISYAPLFVTNIISFTPIILLLAIPAYFSFKSAFISLRLCGRAGVCERGGRREERGEGKGGESEKAEAWEKGAVMEMCKNGFTGMTLMPLALIFILLSELV